MENKKEFSLSYRPEIDGLRTIAVSAVILFHCGFSFLSGGFIGVDIFFVISGFLITTLLCRDIQNESFSITAFYAKRLRRLYPALLFTIVVTLVAGYFIFMPDEMKELGQSTVSVVAYVSNVFFWLKSDYFDGPSELKPLLHTWSLAVEEQFYIVFPLVLLAVQKFWDRISLHHIFFLLAISLIGCLVLLNIDNSAAFYLMPFRAWEFLIGSVCSFVLATPHKIKEHKKNWLSIFGMSLIVGSIFVIDEGVLFPGLAAIPVTVGTALVIIFTTRGTLVQQFLASKSMVFLGKISYSTYLVHWPIVVFYNYSIIRESTAIEKIGLCVASFAIGYVFFKFIENSFRTSTINYLQIKKTFIATFICSVFLAASGLLTHFENGFKGRFDAPQNYQENKVAVFPKSANCFLSTKETFELWTGQSCFIGGFDARKESTLIWGDSHAEHLKNGVFEYSNEIQRNVLLFASAGCAPIFDEIPNNRPNCPENNEYVLDIIKEYNIQRVILAGNWQYARSQGVDIKNLPATVKKLLALDLEVGLINQLPIYPFNNPEFLHRRLSSNTNFDGNWKMKPAKGKVENELIYKLPLHNSTVVFNPFESFCELGHCTVMKEHQLMIKDSGHLSSHGSRLMIRNILSSDPAFF